MNLRFPPPGSRTTLLLAAVVYGLFGGAAFVWAAIAGSGPIVDPLVFTWPKGTVGSAAGLALGLAVAGASRLLVAHARWGRQLYQWFAEVLGPMPDGEVLALALLSAVGEELFFRGAMQPTLGLWPTTILFGMLHFPSRVRLVPWTLMAGLFGLLFGLLTLWSGTIAGAVLAHFTINLLNLRGVARFAEQNPTAVHFPGEKLPGADRPPSMEHHEEPPTAPSSHPGPGDPADDDSGQR